MSLLVLLMLMLMLMLMLLVIMNRDPHLLKFHGAYIHKQRNQLWIVTEYIDGCAAKDLVCYPLSIHAFILPFKLE
jgi:hypothetical protein